MFPVQLPKISTNSRHFSLFFYHTKMRFIILSMEKNALVCLYTIYEY